ncbi:MAG: ComEA family DNA-binding protein [Chloroflexota bacterium]
MAAGRQYSFWTLAAVLLAVIIVTGGLVIWSKYSPSQPIEISLAPAPETQGQIYAGGAVNNPGFYPLEAGDSLANIIQAAGGASDNADLNRLRLYVPEAGAAETPQRVDINHAEAWLLQALPGIGAARAQAIIDYRQQNGPFRNTSELTGVAGISSDTYEKIKDLITVDSGPG